MDDEGRLDLTDPDQVTDLVRAFRVPERELIDLAPRVGYSIRRIREHLGCWRFRDLENAKSESAEPRKLFAAAGQTPIG
jgi:hypothetical protein